MDQVRALKKAEGGGGGGGNMTKSASMGSLLWRSNASVSAPRTLVVRNEALSSSTYSLNWSGVQAHTKTLSQIHASDANLRDGEILSPTGVLTPGLAITAFIAAFGSSFPHGYNTGVLNSPSALIKDFLNETLTSRFGSPPSEGALSFVWALTVSIYLVGGCGGAFSAGWIADKFGRKKGLLFCHVFGFVAAALFATCKAAGSFEMFILARLIVGYGCGAGTGLVPMYLTEIAPVNIRGAMGVVHQFALTCGILVSQCMGLKQALGTENLWPILLAFTAFPALVSSIGLPFFPESPRYLLVTKGDETAAREALTKFRGTDDIALDIQEMRQEQRQKMAEPEWSFRELLRTKNLRTPLYVVCALAMCQQLSGINVVFYYSNGVFLGAGIPEDKTPYAVLGTGFINVLVTGISVPLVERSGRRPLLMGGMLGMAVSAVIITVALNLQPTVPWMAYVSIICIITFVIGFAIGLGSIPQFIGGELFKQGPRPPAMSIAGLLNWLCNFLVGISFPSIAMGMGPYSFTIFIVFLVIFGIYIWKKLPETKNKTYEELYREFKISNPEIAGSRLSLNKQMARDNEKGGSSLEAQVLLKNAYSSAARLDADNKELSRLANGNGLHSSSPSLNASRGMNHSNTSPSF